MNRIALVLILLLKIVIAKNDTLTVGVPSSVSTCSPFPLEINGGTPPYSVSVNDVNNPTGPSFQEFNNIRQPSNLSLASNFSAGAVVTFNVKDCNGLTTSSDQISISTDCQKPALNQTSNGTNASANAAGSAVQGQFLNTTGASNSSSSDSVINSKPIDANASSVPPMGLPLNSTATNTTADVGLIKGIQSRNSSEKPSPSPSGSSNINGSKNNQTANPKSSNRSSSTAASSKDPPISKHSIIITTFVVVLSTLN